ncbi:MAG TPA: helix-turn-helix transcriptional regulator [Firmicutes bacterium]|jgi:DNA-binding HxlR family transcriptional regulator|nr:helix-turn-helix transcriptional regulator [Bacillota bacterium]
MSDRRCPIESTLAIISGKWKILIMKALAQGPVRYGEISKEIPAVSSKVLTQQLREMEKDGLIVRKVFPEIPPRVEYSLSKMGASLSSVLGELRNWGLTEDKVHDVECTYCKKCHDIMFQVRNAQ